MICLVWVGLALTACQGVKRGFPADLTAEMAAATVEVDLFSGQPNPSWQLTAAETAELAALITALPESETIFAPPGNQLGFRGFVLYDLPLEGMNGARIRINFKDGIVSLSGERGEPHYLSDEEQVVWNRLKTMSAAHLPTDLYGAVWDGR